MPDVNFVGSGLRFCLSLKQNFHHDRLTKLNKAYSHFNDYETYGCHAIYVTEVIIAAEHFYQLYRIISV